MKSFRMLLAAPFFIVAAIAGIAFALRPIFLVLNVINGVPILDALWAFLVDTVILVIILTISGFLAYTIAGPENVRR